MGRRPEPPRDPVFCSVEGCNRRAKQLVLALCVAHYTRHKNGTAVAATPVRQSPVRFVHGTIRGYTDFNCRCSPCREANRVSCRRAREKRMSRPVPDHVHGTTNGYSSYACRCADCSRAAREARRRAGTGAR